MLFPKTSESFTFLRQNTPILKQSALVKLLITQLKLIIFPIQSLFTKFLIEFSSKPYFPHQKYVFHYVKEIKPKMLSQFLLIKNYYIYIHILNKMSWLASTHMESNPLIKKKHTTDIGYSAKGMKSTIKSQEETKS